MTTGYILYDGPSRLDGEPIVCIATGIEHASLNAKTGPMVQTWILRSDIPPETAINDGSDSSVCGNCALRGIVTKLPNGEVANRLRACYVFVGQAPQKIWESFRKGDYKTCFPPAPSIDPAAVRAQHGANTLGSDGERRRNVVAAADALLAGRAYRMECESDQTAGRVPGAEGSQVFSGRMARIGSYGDPCAVPLTIWNNFARFCAGHTGYTHQWRDRRFQDYRSLLMASVESEADARVARAMGWRTFRVAVTGELPARGEFHCPATKEQGHRETCETCGSCDGTGDKPDRASVVIWPHGPPAAVKSFYRLVRGDSQQIIHRQATTEADRSLLAELSSLGRSSASALASRVGRGTQAVATRLWHLRQMGLARRVGRGQYEAMEAQ